MTALLESAPADDRGANVVCTLIYSDAPSLTRSRGWGGARNTSDRQSDHIKLETALGLVEGVRRAMEAGVPFNRHLTVHWALCSIPDREAAAATGRLIKLIADWARKRGGRFAHAWVREMGPKNGSHAHMLLHIPKHLKLGHMTSRWVRSISGKLPKGAIKTKTIGGTAKAAFSGSDWYENNLAAVVAYILKGVGPETGFQLGLDDFAMGGRIIGKRVSVSQSLRQGGRGRANPCKREDGQRPQSFVTTLNQFFSEEPRARAHARGEPDNQNFADDLGKSGEAA